MVVTLFSVNIWRSQDFCHLILRTRLFEFQVLMYSRNVLCLNGMEMFFITIDAWEVDFVCPGDLTQNYDLNHL